MRIEIEIPKEFEEHFKQDRFEDSLNRLLADANLIAGRYERELAEMLIKSFKESKPGYNQDKVVEELKHLSFRQPDECVGIGEHNRVVTLDDAIEIVKQDGVADDVCEWKSDYGLISDKYKKETSCGYTFYGLHHAVPFKFCPYCGKKIKVVE